MKYKEFVNWCNERACDGRWGPVTAMVCIAIMQKVRSIPFWKRGRVWRKEYEKDITEGIVIPINSKIESMCQERRSCK